jgi:hypothetical protein
MPDERVARQLHFSYGVHPVPQPARVTDWDVFTRAWVAEHGLPGTIVILLRGPSRDRPHGNHALELVQLGTAAGTGAP